MLSFSILSPDLHPLAFSTGCSTFLHSCIVYQLLALVFDQKPVLLISYGQNRLQNLPRPKSPEFRFLVPPFNLWSAYSHHRGCAVLLSSEVSDPLRIDHHMSLFSIL